MIAQSEVKRVLQNGYRLVFLDEFCTTARTIPTHDYGLRNQILKYDQGKYHKKTLASIMAISEQNGIEYINSWEKSVDQAKFIQFLKKLRQKDPFSKIALFCDRLSVHKCTAVTETCQQLRLERILNASYSPNYNPIEGVIGLAKH